MQDIPDQASSDYLPDRPEIIRQLSEKNWFKNTDGRIQQELFELSSDFDGFLQDLAGRPEKIGLVDVVRLLKISAGNFMVIPVFEVRSQRTQQLFTYEYVSWRHGKLGGYKGIILIEVDNEIKYFMVKVGEKFPTAGLTYDAVGTNQFSPMSPKKFFLQSNIENQIKKMLEVDEIPVGRFIDLGILNTDPSMTNNHVGLFAIILQSDQKDRLEKLTAGKTFSSALKVGYRLEMHPIARLFEFISKCNDSFFLACFSRLIASHIISP